MSINFFYGVTRPSTPAGKRLSRPERMIQDLREVMSLRRAVCGGEASIELILIDPRDKIFLEMG